MKNKKTVYYFVFDGMADYEALYALTMINRSGQFQIKTIGLNKDPKQALSGIEVLPTTDFIPAVDLKDIDRTTTAMLILPGGSAWQEGENLGIVDLVLHCLQQQITVAAISDAAIFLADVQAFDTMSHRNNNYYSRYNFIKDYTIVAPAGTSPFKFAKDIFETLELETNVMEVEKVN